MVIFLKPTTVGIPQAHKPKTNVLRAYRVNTCRKPTVMGMVQLIHDTENSIYGRPA